MDKWKNCSDAPQLLAVQLLGYSEMKPKMRLEFTSAQKKFSAQIMLQLRQHYIMASELRSDTQSLLTLNHSELHFPSLKQG